LGRVKVITTADDGGQIVGRIVRAEGLFGESSLIGPSPTSESAVALEKTTLMSWNRNELERLVEREPRLGLALLQSFARQGLELQTRIESLATRKTPERVTLALLQLARELGSPMPDGFARVSALSHHTIAGFVGTSREVVTCEMNRLRRQGMVRYSRQHIDVYADAIRENLVQQGISIPSGTEAIARVRVA